MQPKYKILNFGTFKSNRILESQQKSTEIWTLSEKGAGCLFSLWLFPNERIRNIGGLWLGHTKQLFNTF